MITKIKYRVVTWERMVTKMHKKYTKELKDTPIIVVSMQYMAIKKKIVCISFDFRRKVANNTDYRGKELYNSGLTQLNAKERTVEQEDLEFIKE